MANGNWDGGETELMQYPRDATLLVSSAHSSYSQYHLPLSRQSQPQQPCSRPAAALCPDTGNHCLFTPIRDPGLLQRLQRSVATNAVIIIYTVSTFYGVAILKCN